MKCSAPFRFDAARLAAGAIMPAAVLLWAFSGSVTLAQPTISHSVPMAAAPGKTTEITLHGAKLQHPLRVWSSFPAQIEILPADPKQKAGTQAVCKVTLAAGVPAGIGGLIVSTPEGASDVLHLFIGDLPTIADNGKNHDLPVAQETPLPCAIDGLCDGTTFDYYRFIAKAGQRVSVDVIASRLGWDYDPVVRVLDGGGSEVLRADDNSGAGADCRFVFTAPADGPYVLELRDNRYKAGGRYRLRLGDFPLVSRVEPMAVQAGVPSEISFAGSNAVGLAPFTFLTTAANNRELPISVRSSSSQATGWSTLIVSDLPVHRESSQAIKPDESTPVTLPCAMAGVLEAPADKDSFEFTATKGTPISFRATTRSSGSAAIVTLRLVNAAGGQVAESPVNDSDEPVLNFTIPADGAYKLAVEELAGRGGSDYGYLVEACTGPQFTLSLKNDKNNRVRYGIPRGGAFTLDVQCQRFAYDGPIELAIDSPRPGWQLFNAVIPAKANEARVYVVAPLDFSPAEFSALRIVGCSSAGSADHSAAMITTLQLRTARPQMPYPPTWLDGMISASCVADKPAFYTATASKAEVNFPRLVGQAQLTLDFERTNAAFKDVPLTVLPLHLPPGISATVKRNGNGPKETYDIVLTGAKDLPEGQHTFRYFAYAEMAGLGQAGQSGDIRVNVITPLAVTATPAGPLVAGQKQKVKLTLTRRGDDKQPAEIKFKELPPGVTAPDKTPLSPEQTEVEVELSAAADAAPVKFEKLVAVATSKYAGTDISVESAAATLEVKAP